MAQLDRRAIGRSYTLGDVLGVDRNRLAMSAAGESCHSAGLRDRRYGPLAVIEDSVARMTAKGNNADIRPIIRLACKRIDSVQLLLRKPNLQDVQIQLHDGL